MENSYSSEIAQALLVGTLVFFMLSIGMVAISIVYNRKMHKKQEALHQMEIQHERSLLEHYILATEEERSRLASDLHDDVGTRLSALRFALTAIAVSENVSGIKEDLDGIIQNVRAIAHNIMPSSIELFGLSFALNQLVDSLRKVTDIEYEVQLSLLKEPDKKTALAIYRMMQELINNTLKHAHAKKISIVCEPLKKGVFLRYADDGTGFTLSASTGLGIKSIENRARMIHASWNWKMKDPGMSFELVIPHHEN